MKLLPIFLLAAALHAATIIVTVTNDAGQQTSSAVVTTTDAVLAEYASQTKPPIHKFPKKHVPTAEAKSIPLADAVKAEIVRRLPRVVDANIKALMDQQAALQAKIAALQGAQVK